DIILSNIAVVLSEDGKGQIKETAAVYNMIRGAKPGIFPRAFVLDMEFRNSVIYYDSYDDLMERIKELVVTPSKLIELKTNALKLSRQYSGQSLLSRLTELKS